MSDDDPFKVPLENSLESLTSCDFVAPAPLVLGRRFRLIPHVKYCLPPQFQCETLRARRRIADVLNKVSQDQCSTIAMEEGDFPYETCATYEHLIDLILPGRRTAISKQPVKMKIRSFSLNAWANPGNGIGELRRSSENSRAR